MKAAYRIGVRHYVLSEKDVLSLGLCLTWDCCVCINSKTFPFNNQENIQSFNPGTCA
jgi:hypothetical protein